MSTQFLLNIFNKPGEQRYLKILQYPETIAKVIYSALTGTPSDVSAGEVNSTALRPTNYYASFYSTLCGDNCINNSENNLTLYFFDSGTISIAFNQITLVLEILNPVTKTASSTSNYTFKNKATLKPNNPYVFSKPFGAYLLYVKSPTDISLRYNPVPRPEITGSLKTTTKGVLSSLIANSCLETKTADPVCSCINIQNTDENRGVNTEFCMTELLGSSETRKAIKELDATAYGQMFKICDCSNVRCVEQSHPFHQAWRSPTVGVNEACPSNLAITICDTQFNVGRDMTATGNLNLAQKCGNYLAGGGGGVTKTGGIISRETVDRSSTSTSTSGVSSTSSQTDANSGVVSIKEGGTVDNTTGIIIGSVVGGVVLIGLLILIIVLVRRNSDE